MLSQRQTQLTGENLFNSTALRQSLLTNHDKVVSELDSADERTAKLHQQLLACCRQATTFTTHTHSETYISHRSFTTHTQ